MRIFYMEHNKVVMSVNTEKVEKEYKEIEAQNFDDILDKFKSKGLSVEEEQQEELRDIFSEDEENESIEEFKIKHWVSNRSFGELVDMYKNGEIKKPEMQRKFVWNSVKSSRLIESIILGLPIPPLFLLEVNDNEYEVIDGFQRLTTLYNYMEGFPWTGKKSGVRNIASVLSRKHLIIKEIQGKKYSDLSEAHKTKIRRSTIPLVEFKQLSPGDFSSKYLIFERINTGAEKLNAMQIRKSLAYGSFLKELYEKANNHKNFVNLFTPTQVKKDIHVEALLRVIAFSEIRYDRFKPTKYGIKNILDEYGEIHKNDTLDSNYIDKVFKYLDALLTIFSEKNIFRRVNMEGKYEGTLNIGILESLLGCMVKKEFDIPNNFEKLYVKSMMDLSSDTILNEQSNPFTTSTGARRSILLRYEFFERMMRG